ncbi:MAG: hypothetical protein HYY22_02530 [Thaumarchaeota archaeon]|nr:hypothetical protein [Nitrososphaerota archaeon]
MVAPTLDTLREKLDVARRTVEEQFPRYWFAIDALLSAIATLRIADVRDPASLILEGPPSSGKSTCLRIVESSPLTYRSDKFTAKAFVTLQANMSEEELRKKDLLTRIKGKCLLVSDLTTILSDRTDRLKENIANLTRVFDGDGLVMDAGSVGSRGYTGEYQFVLLAGTTPLPNSTWRTLGRLGNRLCFLNMSRALSTGDPHELALEITGGLSFKDKVDTCRKAVSEFLTELEDLPKVEWDRGADNREVESIMKLATLSGCCRGIIPRERSSSGDYERKSPEVEVPRRFTMLLYNLARGHALINGRSRIEVTDVSLAREVALSSTPKDRENVLRWLETLEVVPTSDIATLLNCSKPIALDVMDDLILLNVVERVNQEGTRSSIFRLRLDFKEALAQVAASETTPLTTLM